MIALAAILIAASQPACPAYLVELRKVYTVEQIESAARTMGVSEPTIRYYKRVCLR